MRSLLCETSERPLALAEFSDRAPLTRLFPSLKNLPSHVRDPRYWIPEFVTGTWIPDSGFRWLVRIRIPWAVFRIQRAKTSRILQSGFPYIGWKVPQWPCIHCSCQEALSWRRSVGQFSWVRRVTMSSQNLILNYWSSFIQKIMKVIPHRPGRPFLWNAVLWEY